MNDCFKLDLATPMGRHGIGNVFKIQGQRLVVFFKYMLCQSRCVRAEVG